MGLISRVSSRTYRIFFVHFTMADMRKFLDMQANIRNEQQDLGKYMRELNNWSQQIKEKDDTLRKQESVDNKTWLENPKTDKNSPRNKPVNNSINSSNNTSSQQSSKHSYIKTTPAPRSQKDWDKFDIDEALEEIDERENNKEKEEAVSLIKQKEKMA